MNHLNKDGKPWTESEEGRPLVKENTHQSSTHSTQSEARVSQGLARVRKAAKERKGMQFTALLHHLTVALLREGFYALKRKAAPGVDGVTWEEYESGLEGRLVDLHSRVHRGAYRAQPSRRVYIPKPDGRQRPLGVAALEDKIVQHAVVTILNQINEEDFRGFSYGFRPGRRQHQALDALYVAITRKKVNFVLDADIRGFFDNLDRGWLLKFLQHRVADLRMLRLIQKWLEAGVMEEGEWKDTETYAARFGDDSPNAKDNFQFERRLGFGGNRVQIDVCRTRLYVYDRCHARAKPRRPSASIVHGTASRGRAISRCCRAPGTGVFHLAASGLSVSRTSAASETTDPATREQTGVYNQTPSQSDSAGPSVRRSHRIVDQRGGQPSVARAAAARARAWVSRNPFGSAPCSWNIDSIVSCQTNSLRFTSCSCQIGISQSEEKLWNKRIQPQE